MPVGLAAAAAAAAAALAGSRQASRLPSRQCRWAKEGAGAEVAAAAAGDVVVVVVWCVSSVARCCVGYGVSTLDPRARPCCEGSGVAQWEFRKVWKEMQ